MEDDRINELWKQFDDIVDTMKKINIVLETQLHIVKNFTDDVNKLKNELNI